MENRPFPIPTGEAFLVKTPYLDKVANDIYKNEQAEKQRYYKENQMLDKEFSSELTKMRAVDIPDFEKKYGEFKQARIELMKKGNKATPQDYYSVLQKKSEAFRIPARSIEVKKEDEELLKEYKKNGKNYETHTPNVLYERRKTPLSQFEKKFTDPVTGEERVIDLNNVNDIITYKGPTTDFSKAFKTAAGTWMKRGNPIEEDTDGGLSRKVTTYKGYNSPAQFAGSLYEQVNVSPRSKRDFEEKHNYSDEEAANILDRYEQLINSPEFKNAYPDSEEIPAKLFQTKLGRAIALSTMKYMTDNRPQAEFKTERNLDAIMDRKWKEKLDFAAIQQQRKERNIRLNKEGGGSIEFDNIPLKLEEETKSVPILNPDTKKVEYVDVVDITDYPQSYKNDIFGDEKNTRTGMLKNRPIIVQGREYIKKTPDGWVGENNYKVNDKDIYTRTYKRSVPNYEKPVGTGKAKIRGAAAGQKSGGSKSNNNPLDLDL